MSKRQVILDEFQLGVDLCPHTLSELIDDLQSTNDRYVDDPLIVIEGGHVTLFKEEEYKPKAIVFDSDEVLLNWPLGFRDWHNKKYGTDVKGLDYFDNIENLFDIPHAILEPRMREFNAETWEFGDLSAMYGAVAGIKRILDHNFLHPDDKIHIHIITKCGNEHHVRNMRILNLVKVFGDIFSVIITLDIKDTKVDAINELAKDYELLMFVDDYFKNIEQVRDGCNVPVYALAAPHNKHLSFPGGAFACADWSQLAEEINSVIKNS